MTGDPLGDPLDGAWDVIVIGAGMGGGIAARALAEAGLGVLILDRGRIGHRAEATHFDQTIVDPVARAVRGFWPEPVTARVDGRERVFHAPVGAGPGGSSVFYAATLERPEPHDLDHSEARPHPTGGWPVTFAHMRPWFDRAEEMLCVHGTADPLSGEDQPALLPAQPPSAGDTAVMERLAANGMHPYRLHAALRYVAGCEECFGRKCPRPCKMDGRSAGVEPALATGRAAYVGEVEVRRLVGEAGRVDGVEIWRHGAVRIIRAPNVVLAAGAFGSPRIAMASVGIGLAGPMGHNLMFHLNEMFAVFPGRAASGTGPSKSVGFRDLYHRDGARLGMVQAMGVDAGEGEILHILRERAERTPLGRSRLVREALRLPAKAAARLLGNAKLFVGLIEDLPLPENRVELDPADPMAIRFDYRVTDELKARRATFRREIRRAFKGMPVMFLNRAPEPNFGHPCGTLAMAGDPARGVVDSAGRAHGVENLWIADASVFPTSMGVNPSLTIAALALRVADQIKGGGHMTDGIAIVTGAGRGLGRALAQELARRGVTVAGFGRNAGDLAETGAGCNGRFHAVLADMADPASMARGFVEADAFGSVTILINNAALYPRRDVLDETPASFAATIDVNLGGVVSATHEALARMVETGRGRIVNVASMADVAPLPASAAYSVSKGAARVFSRALVADLADRFPGIVISDWMPGMLATRMGVAEGLRPDVAARWGVELALMADGSLNGTLWEMDRELLPPRGLKGKVKDLVLMRRRRPRTLRGDF